MSVPAFRTGYAAARLQGVAMMLEDATSVVDVADALAHLETVYRETMREAAAADVYGFGAGLPR